jgi:hypothetical protein
VNGSAVSSPYVEGLSLLFERLDAVGIEYCLLRGSSQLEVLARQDDVDLLVRAQHAAALTTVLETLGFAEHPARRYRSHRFFIHRHEQGQLKLDVVTELVYGRLTPYLCTDLARTCLASRVRADRLWRLAPEVEFVTLLLHCALDKGRFAPHWRQRLAELANGRLDQATVADLLHEYGLSEALADVRASEWTRLLVDARRVRVRLILRRPLATVKRFALGRLERKLGVGGGR